MSYTFNQDEFLPNPDAALFIRLLANVAVQPEVQVLVPNNPEVSDQEEAHEALANEPGDQQAMQNSQEIPDQDSDRQDARDYGDYGESYDVSDSEVIANQDPEAGQIEEAKDMPYGYKILQQRSNM